MTRSNRHEKRAAAGLDRLSRELWRTIVDLDLGAAGRRNIGVVAVDDGDGASTVARALASASATLVRRPTVLVDADTHDRALTRLMRLEDRSGLVDWNPEEPIAPVTVRFLPGVGVIGAGSNAISITEALASGRVRGLLEALGRTNLLAVWELPAILRHPDAKALIGALDGAILVTEADRTPLADVRLAANEIRGTGRPLLAAIMNRAGRYSLGLRA